jgi:hypothetical protein
MDKPGARWQTGTHTAFGLRLIAKAPLRMAPVTLGENANESGT